MPEADRPDSDDPWLTPTEIAKEIRVNAATIRLWISKGLLPATRAGQRKLLVRRSEVVRLLAENSSAGGVQPYRSPQHPRYTSGAEPGAAIKGGWTTSSLFAREGDPAEFRGPGAPGGRSSLGRGAGRKRQPSPGSGLRFARADVRGGMRAASQLAEDRR
ncbi:MAG: helix-turn-helix domain-containing protein [Solirubrobacteraceae bacterium]